MLFIFLNDPSGFPPYSKTSSNSSNNFGVETIFTLLLGLLQGITITVSPSKSAPDNLSATDLDIPTASFGFVPYNFFPSGNSLFTVSIGISNVPP